MRLREFSVQGEEGKEDYEKVREIMQVLGATICLDTGYGMFQRIVGIYAEPPASVEYIERQTKGREGIEKTIICTSLNGGIGMAELERKLQTELTAKNLVDITLQPYQQHLPTS